MEPTKPEATPTKPNSKRSARSLPESAAGLSELLNLAVAEWANRPTLTLEWTTQAKGAKLAKDLEKSLAAVGDAQDELSPAAARLKALDRLIDAKDNKLKYVKKALALQYDEENDGKPYYGEFGIVKQGSSYTLPADRGERAKALTKLVAALPKHGLADSKYGTAYWQPLADEYNALQPKAAKATGNRADEIGDKNELVDQAEDLLSALGFLIRANYPKTYKTERRKFGFLKESY